MSNWQNELFDELGWFDEVPDPKHDKIYNNETIKYEKGCSICGTITGEHGFSFAPRKIC